MKNGWSAWKPSLKQTATDLSDQLDGFEDSDVQLALQQAGHARLQLFLDGIKRYQTYPFEREKAVPELIWNEGTTKVRRYGKAGGEVLVLVPSLVNRYYILDLLEDQSFCDSFAAAGYDVWVVDWDAPSEAEADFYVADYIEKRLKPILDLAEKPVILAGYCMGGMLTLAAAQLWPEQVKKLVLIASPWDFAANFSHLGVLWRQAAGGIRGQLDAAGELSVDALQAMFVGLDPASVVAKFIRFNELDGQDAERFVALEDWLNDGVPLTSNVGYECMVDWYGENKPAKGQWQVGGQMIDPAKVGTPTYVIIPTQDKIVPPESAVPLQTQLPNVTIQKPDLGHVGLMASVRAAEKVWQPLKVWLEN